MLKIEAKFLFTYHENQFHVPEDEGVRFKGFFIAGGLFAYF